MQKEDPYRPAWACHIMFGITGRFAGLPEDILGLDHYVILPPGRGRDIASPGHLTRVMMDIGGDQRKPTFIAIQSYGANEKAREPTADEQEAQSYLCVIEGARGLSYFINMPQSVPHRRRFFQISRELKGLIPVFFAPERHRFTAANSVHVRCLAAKTKDGWTVVTVNESPYAIDGVLDLRFLGAPDATAKVLFENRTVKIASGILKDKYPKYRRHVYFVK